MPNSGYVDERVVEMQIDNRQFVSGANKTIGVLDRLQDALSFKKSGDGLNSLTRSINGIDLSGISRNLELISDRFSTMGLIGMRVINQLTDAVSGFVYRTVKDLTLGQVTAGFSKYNSLIESTRTILSATRDETGWQERYGSQLEYVNDQLDQLMWFTDETSYNLADMTSNIAKFTNAGIPLENAVKQMEGVAVWAGASGANANEASRAMYNLSQAIGAGKMTLMDWKSIENANMATKEFKETALEVAVAAGRLKKVGDGIYETAKGTQVTFKNFGQTLSEGWFDKDVIQATLEKYQQFTDVLSSVMDDTDIEDYFSTTQVLDWVHQIEDGKMTIEDWHKTLKATMGDDAPDIKSLAYAFELLTDKQLELGRRAFESSQEYKTLKDAIDATRDAVSTGWVRTFQLMIGDAEQAKKVWTYVGNELYDIFASGAERRNSILELWSAVNGDGEGYNGRVVLLEALKSLYEGVRTYIDPVVDAFKSAFSWGDEDEAAKKLFDLTKKFNIFAKRVALTKTETQGFRNMLAIVTDYIKRVGEAFKPVVNIFSSSISYIRRFISIVLTAFARIDPKKNKFNFEFFKRETSKLFDDVTANLGRFIKESVPKLLGFFKGLIPKIVSGIRLAVPAIISFIKTNVPRLFGFLKEVVNENVSFPNWMNALVDGLNTVYEHIKTVVSFIVGVLKGVKDFIVSTGSSLADKIKSVFSEKRLGVSTVLKVLGGLFAFFKLKGAAEGVVDFFSAFTPIKNILNGFSDLLDNASDALESFTKKNSSYSKELRDMAIILAILAASLIALSMADADKLGTSLLILAGGMAELVAAVKGLEVIRDKKTKNVTKGLISLAASVLVFALALKVLDGTDPDSISRGLIAIAVILALIIAFMEAMNLLKIKPKAVRGVISLAMAMLIFAGVIFVLGSIPYKKLEQGLVSLAIALGVVTVAMILLSQFGGAKALAAGAGMVLLATSLLILVGAIALMTAIDPEKVIIALAELGIALIGIAVVVQVMSAKILLVAPGLLLMAVAIGVLVVALGALTLLDPERLLVSIGALAITLAVLAGAIALMSLALPGAVALLAVSAAMVIGAVAFGVFAIAAKLLAEVPFQGLMEGLVTVSAGLVALALALALMTVGIIGAVALIAAAGGLIVMSFALNMLSGLNLPALAGGLSLLGLAFIPLGIGGLALLLGVPGLIAGAAAVSLMGIALIPLAFGLKQLEKVPFTTILDYLAILAVTALSLSVVGPILTPLAVAIGAFGVACLAAGAGIALVGTGMSQIAESVKAIPEGSAQAFKDVAKAIGESVFDIEPKGEEVVKAVKRIGTNIEIAIGEFGRSAKTTLTSDLNSILNEVTAKERSFKTAGSNIVSGIANGIYDNSSAAINAIHAVAEALITTFREDLGINSPSKIAMGLGRFWDLGLAGGLEDGSKDVYSQSEELAFKMAETTRNALSTVAALASEDFSISPVITPVVDMTGVDETASTISNLFANTSNQVSRVSRIGRNISDIEDLASNMQTISEARANTSQDVYEVNIYSQPGMDEEMLADAVVERLSNGVVRKGVSLG